MVLFAPGLTLVVGPYSVEYTNEDPSALNTEKAGWAWSPLGKPLTQPSYPGVPVGVGQAKLVWGLGLHRVSLATDELHYCPPHKTSPLLLTARATTPSFSLPPMKVE
jgi:hypothetical protein